jgi:Terminase small subunit
MSSQDSASCRNLLAKTFRKERAFDKSVWGDEVRASLILWRTHINHEGAFRCVPSLLRGFMKKATKKQKTFAREYLAGSNGTTAAIAAGYSAKTAGSEGSRLLKNSKVSELISKNIRGKFSGIVLQVMARLIAEEKSDTEITAFAGIEPRALRILKATRCFAKRIERERSTLSLEKSFRGALGKG